MPAGCPQTGYVVNYAYDNGTLTAPGNLTTFGDQSFSYNSDNQIAGYTYDGNGNPVSVNGVGLTYDSQNRVTQAGSESISYRADGMRAYQSDSGGVYYLYDGIDPVEMLSRPGNIVADLEYGANGYLGDRESSSTGSLLTYDPLGNTVHYTNYSGGINTTSLPTGAFGTIGGTNVPTRDFGFQHDLNYSYNAASGLDALGGRFINRDPIGYAGGINVYAYAGSNPVNFDDPLGLWSLYRWMYTGDGNASDCVYNAALDTAAESLPTRLPDYVSINVGYMVPFNKLPILSKIPGVNNLGAGGSGNPIIFDRFGDVYTSPGFAIGTEKLGGGIMAGYIDTGTDTPPSASQTYQFITSHGWGYSAGMSFVGTGQTWSNIGTTTYHSNEFGVITDIGMGIGYSYGIPISKSGPKW